MNWRQKQKLHSTSIHTAWDEELPYSYMYPSNTTVDWADTDTPENAQYIKNIKYTFNEHGFRSDPFNIKSDINVLAVGCSMTVGVGVDQNENWPNRLKQKIIEKTQKSVSMWNLATSGASCDYVSRIIAKSISSLQPNLIVIFWPPISRLEIPTQYEGKIIQGFPHMDIFPKELVDEKYFIYNFRKNKLLVDAISKNYDIPIISNPVFEIDPLGRKFPFIKDTSGRDGQHPGPTWHENIANWYYQSWLYNYL